MLEKKFGVERWILVALWGMETDYGAEKDRWDVFRSLATLGYVKYRDPYFRNELIVAMRIMQDGRFPREPASLAEVVDLRIWRFTAFDDLRRHRESQDDLVAGAPLPRHFDE